MSSVFATLQIASTILFDMLRRNMYCALQWAGAFSCIGATAHGPGKPPVPGPTQDNSQARRKAGIGSQKETIMNAIAKKAEQARDELIAAITDPDLDLMESQDLGHIIVLQTRYLTLKEAASYIENSKYWAGIDAEAAAADGPFAIAGGAIGDKAGFTLDGKPARFAPAFG